MNYNIDGSGGSARPAVTGNSSRRIPGMPWIKNGRKDRDHEDLILFQDLHKREKDRNIVSLLQPVSDEFEPNGNYLLYRIASAKKGSGFEFLADNDKNDYDWLKTPPATPLFPSLETDANGPELDIQREIPIFQPLSRLIGDGGMKLEDLTTGGKCNSESDEVVDPRNGRGPKSPKPKQKNPAIQMMMSQTSSAKSRSSSSGRGSKGKARSALPAPAVFVVSPHHHLNQVKAMDNNNIIKLAAAPVADDGDLKIYSTSSSAANNNNKTVIYESSRSAAPTLNKYSSKMDVQVEDPRHDDGSIDTSSPSGMGRAIGSGSRGGGVAMKMQNSKTNPTSNNRARGVSRRPGTDHHDLINPNDKAPPPPPNLRTEQRSTSASSTRGRGHRAQVIQKAAAVATDHQQPAGSSAAAPNRPIRRQSCSPSVSRGRKVVTIQQETSTSTAAVNHIQGNLNTKGRIQTAGNATQVLGSKMVQRVMNARNKAAVTRFQ